MIVAQFSPYGLVRNIKNQKKRSTGRKLQLIHQYWLEMLMGLTGAKDTLQNIKMVRFLHIMTERHLGQHNAQLVGSKVNL